ncbi:ABC transporter permease [Mucilaginibacter lappiensis]|uniref:ABC-type antimicrobial peptide transport system permease subunit n=1 Tax=Mucilaginibacter lappiensis TaxID=354630 RepID=A0A1N6T9G4_9SPHI|nr:ABC transporter permease [Mucilaginibacter lappiensis]MBB6108151.1 ABC-type antimicrobial peptide transport system permease subunit [Mucilaginibacter lappiensis]MBB6130296.1 ABC-type antimicrobial peptide transport system permease subunit [Mucilaginibacter lappiensis]SIQ50012.1 ABC-type antimicrobial peptide transport system, permease component [Mucilaginibacter lappiensis]
MIKNYLKIAWRNLIKNKVHSFINIAGLSVGMAVVMLISLWIWDELSYNKYFTNYDRLVQVWQHQTFNGNVGSQTAMPIPLGLKLRESYKSDFKYVTLSTWTMEHIITYGDKKITRLGNYVQAELPGMLTLKMVKGTRDGLKDPSSIMINASLAKTLFGAADPIDKTLKIDNQWVVKVTGVYEDMPNNTQFKDVTFFAPWDLYMASMPWLKNAATRWGSNSWQIFAQLAPNADWQKVSAKIKDIKLINIAAQGDKLGADFKPVVFLHPMYKWHLYSEFKNGINTGGSIQFVWMFGIIGVFVLLLACINFMNLSTARSEKRAKEVGIRKAIGSQRVQLIWQFFMESMLIVAFAFILSIVLVMLALPWFNSVADKKMGILWSNPWFWLLGLLFSLVSGIIAGSYPALYLSSFKPIKVLKGTFKVGRLAAIPRKVLVVLQFTVSVTLIIGTIIVFRQIQFAKNRPIGYNRDGLIYVFEKTTDIHNHYAAFRDEIIKSGAALQTSESDSPVTGVWNNTSGFDWRGKPPGMLDDFAVVGITDDFGKTVGWQFKEGRDFSKALLTDSSGIIINEAAAKFMNFKSPIGEIITSNGRQYRVIGIIKDMLMSSPYEPVKQTFFYLDKNPVGVISIKMGPKSSPHESLEKIAAIYQKYAPAVPFDYKFADEEYSKKFDEETRIGKLSSFFAFLAIFISCLGLFGMATFMAEQRVKEIGVRKVLGASVFNLWRLLSTDFVILVIISFVIASPVAYYFMNGWLQGYTYRSEISWWIFGVSAAGAIVITLATVSFQAIKAALANPVKSLRSE